MARKQAVEEWETDEHSYDETEFEFIDELPEPRARKPKADKLLTRYAGVLQNNPGRWALWPRPVSDNSARSLQSALNNENLDDGPVAFHGAKFEASLRGDGNLYVRFV